MKKYNNINSYIVLVFLIFMSSQTIQAQIIKGQVLAEHIHEGKVHKEPLVYAAVFFAGTTIGTSTDKNGKFELKNPANKYKKIVVSFIGYQNDTIAINKNSEFLKIRLKEINELEEVVVNERVGNYVSSLTSIKTEVVTESGLKHLACCNLAESFENNATVDVGFSDAVTGARQIQLLGLAGIYTQIMTEKVPSVHGLSSSFGLNYIPGSWMKAIQISKGTASVTNGYESTTGQINVEYKKPPNSEKLFVNLYANSIAKGEANLISSHQLNNRLSTMFLVHNSFLQHKFDHNKDGFIDKPIGRVYNFMNRWSYEIKNKFHSQLALQVIDQTKQGGQLQAFNEENVGYYKFDLSTRNYQFFWKNGFYLNRPSTSLALISSASYFEQTGFFGNRNYDALQKSAYFNLIFETYLFTTFNKITTGLSYQYDDFNENYNIFAQNRIESVPGAFAQYTFSGLDNFTLIAGLRADDNSRYGLFLTPRIHIKYDFRHEITLRASGGKGYRTANVFAENAGILVSSRRFFFEEELNAEEAWNYGINLTKKIHLLKHEATFTTDFYRTDFVNQVVVDVDSDPAEIHFYNLNGRSYSNSFQAQLSVEPVEGLNFMTAYRLNDVHTTIAQNLKEKPLISRHKGVFSTSYATKYDKWIFDLTVQYNGKTRLPETDSYPVEYQLNDYSDDYFIVHLQATKNFKRLELYAGVENLTNYMQKNPILAADKPFSDYFDASIIYAPIKGRMYYAGLRFYLK